VADSKVTVTEIDGSGAIWVRPILEGVCISCERASSCSKQGSLFRAENAAGLPVSPGDTVRLASSSGAKTVQGLFSLLFPVAAAVLGYAVSPAIVGLAGSAAGEGVKVLGALAFMLAASGLVLATVKFAKKLVKPEITEIVEKGTGHE
jgi:hypothetical protein